MHEKRATIRHTFCVEQRVARLHDGQMPPPEDFEDVRCIDISKDGVAFFLATRPDYKDLVIGLGLPPTVTYLTARVVHVEMIELCGSLIYRVGCIFTGRLQWDEQPESILRKVDQDGAFQFLTEHVPQQN
jgi:hypothetical protein